jgi:hypothetical protein
MERCEALGIDFSTDVQTGLPLCMLPGQEQRTDLKLLTDPGDFWGEDVTSFAYMQGHKRHGSRCGECFFSRVCYGFWNEYLDAYGDEGLEPVVETPRLRELYPDVAAGAEAPRVDPVEASRMFNEGGIRRKPPAKRPAPGVA